MSVVRNCPSEPEGMAQSYWGIFEAVSDGLIIQDSKTRRVVGANSAAAAMHGYSREEFIGLHLTAYVHPDSLHLFTKSAQAVHSGGVFESPAIHIHRDGSPFHVEVRRTAITYLSRQCWLSVVRDVSKRVQAERKLKQRVGARAHEQSVLFEISQTLASTLELQPGLILDQLGVLIKYTHAGLFTLEDSTLVALAVRGTEWLEEFVPFRIRLNGKQTLEELFNGHRPIRIADVWREDPQAKFLRSLLDNGAAALLEGMKSWMWVPLAVKDRIIGGVGVAHEKRNYFTPHHAGLAMTIANQAAITMVNAELYQQAQALAALQERQRLAQNLHDAVNQSLFSAGLIAEVLPRLWERDQIEARQSLEDLRRLTRGAQAEMRALLAELRPAVLTDSSLGDLLRQLVNAFTGRTNIPVSVNITGEHVLSAEIQVALYRICQEALNNIAKHADASRVEIDLQYDAGTAYDTGTVQASSFIAHADVLQVVEVSSVEMRIRDDGHGFNPDELNAPGHYGLGMMRERAEAMGAQMTVTSRPGHGTEVLLRWPGTPKQETL